MIIRKTKILFSGVKALTGNESPKIGILGLNPHAGEGGSFGTEEIDTIIPAIEVLSNWACQYVVHYQQIQPF